MDADLVRVSYATRGLACAIKVSGELTLATEPEFTARVTEALAAARGPVIFDVSGLNFMDCCGARALVRAVQAVPPREAGLHGCSPAMRRILEALGFDLPHQAELPREAPARPRSLPRADPPSRGDTLTARTRAAESNVRQSALQASEVMSRLAATFSELALNSRYRTPPKSDDRGELLALSERASGLSRRYLQHATSAAD